jgi:hypothetical protein
MHVPGKVNKSELLNTRLNIMFFEDIGTLGIEPYNGLISCLDLAENVLAGKA